MVTRASPFSCFRQNPTTFRVIESDKWSEFPLIYVKIYSDVIVVIDTGCGGARSDAKSTVSSLRQYLEIWPVPDNDGVPLNAGGKRNYIVICTHCHFDHIGAIEQFNDSLTSTICASSRDKQFIEGNDRLPTSSLCKFVGMVTPSYKVNHWVQDMENIVHSGKNLGLQIFHTPGHTPDELAIWDSTERTLYVGDSMYGEGPSGPIILVKESVMKDYLQSIAKLKRLVRAWNERFDAQKVKMACGHNTPCLDAQEFLDEVDSFLSDILQGRVKPKPVGTFRDEIQYYYERKDGKLSFRGPARLFAGCEQRAEDASFL